MPEICNKTWSAHRAFRQIIPMLKREMEVWDMGVTMTHKSHNRRYLISGGKNIYELVEEVLWGILSLCDGDTDHVRQLLEEALTIMDECT